MLNSLNETLLKALPTPIRTKIVWALNRDYLNRVTDLDLLFVHIPKTAGVSVKKAVYGHHYRGHRTVEVYRTLLGDDVFEETFTFTFVRHPYSRLASAFQFLRQGGMTPEDQSWADAHLSAANDFQDFVLNYLTRELAGSKIHFWPQSKFVKNSGRIAVDFIGRFESLQEDFDELCQISGLDATLPHANATPQSQDYCSLYDPQMRRVVQRVYESDFDTFDYSPDR